MNKTHTSSSILELRDDPNMISHCIQYIFQDWQVNIETSLKSRLSLCLFRLPQALDLLPYPFRLASPIGRFIYQIFVEWILGIEIPWDTQIGSGLVLQHGHGLVVNHGTIIGRNCTMRNSTTIGNKKLANGSYSVAPKIGDNVDIGANVVIIGSVTVGNNAVIGAGSVVVKDVPEGAIVAGNPARLIRMTNMAISSSNHEDISQSNTTSSQNNSKFCSP